MKSQEANAIPLEEVLGKYGYEPAKRYSGYLMYSSPFRGDSSPSFRVDLNKNKWKDFGEDSSGGVADLVMRLENCSFPQAIQKLEKGEFTASLNVFSDTYIPKPEVSVTNKLVIDSINPLNNKMLLGYMQQRGIDADIAKAYCKEVYYHFGENKDKTCFAIGFPNDKEGIELRNPMFKGCAHVKSITCFDNGSNRCAVFEGFFDFLSYLQYARNHPEIKLPNLNFCVLNTTGMLGKSKDFLSRHSIIHSFMDNDTPGKNALEKMKILVPRGTIVMNESANLYSKHNDFNEFLQACKKKVRAVECEM